MKIRKIAIIVIALTAASLACSVGSLLPSGSEGLTTTSELWSDVPRVDGLEGSDLELPLTARIFVEAWMGVALSEGNGDADVAVFRTQNAAADLEAFYTNERMTANGWAASQGEESTCFTGEEQGVAEIGLFCVFGRDEASAETALILIAIPSEQAGNLEVFFVRLETQVTPTP